MMHFDKKSNNNQARDLIPFMQLNLDHLPSNNYKTKVTLQQQCYRLVPDLLSPSPGDDDDQKKMITTSNTKHSTPNSNVKYQPMKRRQLPQIPSNKKPFEKLWQIGMNRIEENKSKILEKNLERNLRWKLTKANMHLEIKTDPTTGKTVSINIVDDDDHDYADTDNVNSFCNGGCGGEETNKENVFSSSSNVDNVSVGQNPHWSLDWSLTDNTPSSSSFDCGVGTDLDDMIMIQPSTLQTTLDSSSHQNQQQKQLQKCQIIKNNSDSGISSSIDSPSVTLNEKIDFFENSNKINTTSTANLNNSEKSEVEKQTTFPEATHRALFKFCARHPDEIDLQIGDVLYIYQEFDDQWSEGLNIRTGKRGIFPTALVIDVNYSEFVFENETNFTNNASNLENNTRYSCIDFRIQRERFKLDFLGSIEVFKAKGEDVLDESIRRVAIGVANGSSTKLGMAIPFHCLLDISDIGIRMSSDLDQQFKNNNNHNNMKSKQSINNNRHDYFFALVQITYCGYQFKNNVYYFAFITRHPTQQQRFACHVYQSFDNSTRDVAEAVGRAFHRFYNRFVQITLPFDTTNGSSSSFTH